METRPSFASEEERAPVPEEEQIAQYETRILQDLPHLTLRTEQDIVQGYVLVKKREERLSLTQQIVEGQFIHKALHNLVERGLVIEREGIFEVASTES